MIMNIMEKIPSKRAIATNNEGYVHLKKNGIMSKEPMNCMNY